MTGRRSRRAELKAIRTDRVLRPSVLVCANDSGQEGNYANRAVGGDGDYLTADGDAASMFVKGAVAGASDFGAGKSTAGGNGGYAIFDGQ